MALLGIDIEPKLIFVKKHAISKATSAKKEMVYELLVCNYSKRLKKKFSYSENNSGCAILIISFNITSGLSGPNS